MNEPSTVLDIGNKQLVGSTAGEVMVLLPQRRMSKADALLHAAWLVVLADESDDNADFKRILEAVKNC